MHLKRKSEKKIIASIFAVLIILIIGCCGFNNLFVKAGETEENTGSELLDLQNAEITLSKTVRAYTGASVKPTVTSVSIEGTTIDPAEYIVSYKNNKEVGTAKVLVTAKEESAVISGTGATTFKIQPSKTKIKVKRTSGTTRTITWKKVHGATGYKIYRSKSETEGFKPVKVIKGADTLKYTDKKLSSSKYYYYMIRVFRTVNGKNVYSYDSVAQCSLKKYDGPTKDGGEWRYVNGYKLYYDKDGKLVKNVHSLIGKQSSYYVEANIQTNVVTIYAKDGSNGYIIPVKAMRSSAGTNTPTGTYSTPEKYRWRYLVGPCYGQWATRITGHILFHSEPYDRQNADTLQVEEYNKLGTTCSHGCIRLKAGDAKWIYDNCKIGTKVKIFKSSSKGPLGKPGFTKLKSSHTWDPTDPNKKSKCKEKGCH